MRRIAVKRFRYGPHPRLPKMGLHVPHQPPPLRPPGLPPHAHQRRDEWAEEPGPDGALMIGAVALALSAFDAAAISRIVGRERAQSHRREELLFAHAQHGFGARALQQRKWQ